MLWDGSNLTVKAQVFDLTMDFRKQEAMITASRNLGIVDLLRFLTSLVLVKRGGFLSHASAILDSKGRVFVFCGPSESGKTTIARLSGGKTILTDETTAIVRMNGDFYAYATPFAGEFGQVEKNTGAPIRAIFFINKAGQFSHGKLTVPEAIRKMLCSAILDFYDAKLYNYLFDTLSALVKTVPCYELRFRAEPALWEYLYGFIR